MSEIIQPLSNTQLELLKAFNHQLDDDELLKLKEILAQYFAQRAIKLANTAWNENGWTASDEERLLNTKMRKSH
ncbi:MAG: hypothetical protein AAF798_16910 [Bacteroidota bacterium]